MADQTAGPHDGSMQVTDTITIEGDFARNLSNSASASGLSLDQFLANAIANETLIQEQKRQGNDFLVQMGGKLARVDFA